MASQPKIAIPRLERRDQPPQKSAEPNRHRVSRACLNCRSRKVKCNGAQPRCKNCEDNSTNCVYASSRRDRLKTATDHNQDMIRLLTDLMERSAAADKARIESLLTSVTMDVADAAQAVRSPVPSKSTPVEDDNGDNGHNGDRGEADVSAEVGSNDDLDAVDENLLRDDQTRATGYLGKNSEVQWLRRLAQDTRSDRISTSQDESGLHGPPGTSTEAYLRREDAMRMRQEKNPIPIFETSSLNFYLDDEKVELDFLANPLELPPFETAENLLTCFMKTVHDKFPIVAKKPFVSRFYQYYASVGQGQPQQVSPRWQGLLNLVFAIGAVYSHLNREAWRSNDRDHLVYHSRAWGLTLKDPWWFSHPDLPQLQITGLLAIYYLAIGHLNRSWTVSGMSLRSAYALGLHLRNEDRHSSAVNKESLRRIWWGLYVLECELSTLTGRPSIALQSSCSVPLPLPLATEDMDEAIIISRFGNASTHSQFSYRDTLTAATPDSSESSLVREPANSGSFLKACVKISILTQDILSELYSAQVSTRSWEDVQHIISRLNDQLDVWVSSLPQGYSISLERHHIGYKDRMSLELSYLTTKIILTRPCLCRIDRHIPSQSKDSDDFNRRVAEACVDATLNIARILPDNPNADPTQIYKLGPWWAMVHIIMQALTIMLIELSGTSTEMINEKQGLIVQSLKILFRCLRAMRRNNAMAERAHEIALRMMKRVASKNPDLNIEEILLEEATDTGLTMSSDPSQQADQFATPLQHREQHPPGGQSGTLPSFPHPYSGDYNTQQDISDGFATASDSFEQPPYYDSSNVDFFGNSNFMFPSLPAQTGLGNLLYFDFDEQNPLFAPSTTSPQNPQTW